MSPSRRAQARSTQGVAGVSDGTALSDSSGQTSTGAPAFNSTFGVPIQTLVPAPAGGSNLISTPIDGSGNSQGITIVSPNAAPGSPPAYQDVIVPDQATGEPPHAKRTRWVGTWNFTIGGASSWGQPTAAAISLGNSTLHRSYSYDSNTGKAGLCRRC